VNLLLLYLEFFHMGLFSVGGGFATLPFLFLMANDRFVFVQRTGWLNTETLGNFIAIAQCAPGAIGVNIAVQAGFQYGGIAGGVIATLGLVSPAIIIITLLSKMMQSIRDNRISMSVFSGLRPAAAGLLSAAGFGVWKLALYDAGGTAWFEIIRWRESLVVVALFLLLTKFGGHPVIYIALGALAGVLLGL